MQDCLDEIEAQNMSALDQILVQRVKIQLAAEKCARSTSYDASSDPDTRSDPPPGLFAQEMLTQLNRMSSDITSQQLQDGESSRWPGVMLCYHVRKTCVTAT